MAGISGIVLAAGAGARAGGPKALLRLGDGTPWLTVATTVLLDGGCGNVVVVLGAMARLGRPLVPIDPRVVIVVAENWEQGMSASLRAGLASARGDAALITLVDLPGLPVAVVQRLAAGAGRGSLRQAVYAGRPGHPVLIGADHWAPAAETLSGDRGARDYLVAHDVDEIECSDLWDGEDRDAVSSTDSVEK
jgi:CTP:molybdopterin cytidylyltransferase MocA